VDKYDIIFPFLDSGVGGSHIATFRLGRSLREYYGLKCLVLCVGGSQIEREAKAYGLDAASHGERPIFRNNPFYDLTKVAQRVGLLRKYGGDGTIVHLNDIESCQSWAPCAKFAGLKVVYHHWSLNRPAIPNRIALAFPDAYICISDLSIRNIFYVDRAKVTKVYYSVPVNRVDRAEARRNMLRDSGAPDDAILVGFIGSFMKRKRAHYFLDACPTIAAGEPRARFLVFGRAADYTREEMEAHAEKLGVRDRVIFMGFRSPPEENLAALNVLASPALLEPYGLTPMEALQQGTPYVITADAGNEELGLRWGGGLLVPREAPPAEYGAEVLRVIRGEVNPVVSEQRRAELAEQVSPRTQARQVMAVYRRVCPRADAFAGVEAPA
jgi:glycosyltransferase involved in cell wall biosynthesis